MVIVPPGVSTITLETGGTVFRIFAAATEPHLAARCANAVDYDATGSNVADFAAWPDPSGRSASPRLPAGGLSVRARSARGSSAARR